MSVSLAPVYGDKDRRNTSRAACAKMARSGEAWALGAEMSNVTNSTPYTEGDARWCYRDGKVDACVRWVLDAVKVQSA